MIILSLLTRSHSVLNKLEMLLNFQAAVLDNKSRWCFLYWQALNKTKQHHKRVIKRHRKLSEVKVLCVEQSKM